MHKFLLLLFITLIPVNAQVYEAEKAILKNQQITSVKSVNYTLTSKLPVNKNANKAAVKLYSRLRKGYGKKILSGQTFYWEPLLKITGKQPVVRAFDFQHYTDGYPYLWNEEIQGKTFGHEDDGSTREAINWYQSTNGKGIVSFLWHWHSPTGGRVDTNTFYTKYTTFDISKIADKNSTEYNHLIRDLDAIAVQLKKLKTAGVPVLWRPLHEADGGWFWWGAKGPKPCLDLYNLMFDRFTNYHKLNNLIWVWSSPNPGWYPGNDKVDIIGYDSYPEKYNYTSQKSMFDTLYRIVKGKKMIAMTENGPIPNPDECYKKDAMWLYFTSWNDMVSSNNSIEHIQKVYKSPLVETLDK